MMFQKLFAFILVALLVSLSCREAPKEEAKAPAVAEAQPEAAPSKPELTESLVKADGLPTVPGGYTVQLGAFRDKDVAQNIASQMISRGYKGYIQKAQIAGIGLVYRVRVGAYTTQEEARSVKREVLNRYAMEGWIDHYVPPSQTPLRVS
jgi:cell division septation protein DedD